MDDDSEDVKPEAKGAAPQGEAAPRPEPVPALEAAAGPGEAEATGEAEPAAARRELEQALESLPFQRDVIAYLKEEEAEHWEWYSSTSFLDELARSTRLELLKSCYRFEAEEHPELYELLEGVRSALGISVPVTLYQSQSAGAMNAFLSYVPDAAHVVLEGPVRTTLSEDELRATLAHELTHHLLWDRVERELLVADHMLAAMSSHRLSEPSHAETARLFRIYLEVHADRGALAVVRDPLLVISSLIKLQTGLSDVKAESYLRQAEEIFGQGEVKTEELTHPETYIRARALKLWADDGDGADAEVARMIEGRLDLGGLTLLGQKRLTAFTRRVLLRFLAPKWLRTDALLAHARHFFPDFEPEDGDEGPALRDEVEGAHASVRQYLTYVLLDLATVERSLDEAPLAAALRMAQELDVEDEFLKAAGAELDLSRQRLGKLQKQAPDILAEAAAAGRSS